MLLNKDMKFDVILKKDWWKVIESEKHTEFAFELLEWAFIVRVGMYLSLRTRENSVFKIISFRITTQYYHLEITFLQNKKIIREPIKA